MSARTTAERLGDFARRAKDAGTDLELHHAVRGLVARWDKGEEAPSGTDIELCASDHAAALHGRQSYELRAVYPEGATKQAMPFRVSGEASEGDAAPEPASEKGVIAMLQRQNERLLTSLERGQKPIVDALDRLGEMVAQFQSQQGQLFKGQLEIASLQLEREEAQAQRVLAEKKWDTLSTKLGPVADAILARLMPGAAGKGEEKLFELAASLSKEQQAAIFAFLEPDQLAMFQGKKFAELMASILERQGDKLMALLTPEQIAMVDAIVQGKKAPGAP